MLDALGADAPRVRVRGLQVLSGATVGFALAGGVIAWGDPAHVGAAAAAGALAVLTGGLLFALAERLPEWGWHAIVGALVVATGGLVYAGGGGGLSLAAALLLLWVGAQAALFASRAVRRVLGVLAVAVFSAALLLAGASEPLLPVVALAASFVAVTKTVGWLGTKARQLARIDDMTGCASREWWEHTVEHEVARVRRSGQPLCVAVLSIDGFREFAFERGHAAAELLLRETGEAWVGSVRGGDLLGRLGPDMFGLLLPDCGAGAARIVVGRLQNLVPDSKTCSAGVALWDGAEPSGAVINRATGALRLARNAGRPPSFIAAA